MSNPRAIGRDCTVGSIPRHLIAVALPMLIGNLMQSGYSIIDAIWVGRTVGNAAMGGIAVSFPILFLFIAIAAGVTMATTILISQYFGAGNHEQVKKTIGTSFLFAFFLGSIVSVAGFFSTDAILRLLNTPESVIKVASVYLKINFCGFLIMYSGFLIGSILRGIGDSKTPMVFMAVGVVINAVLDPFLIMGIGPFPRMGLAGAAIASVSSQLVASLTGYLYLRKKGNIVGIHFSDLVWNSQIVKKILTIGFPSMLQQSAISLGLVTIAAIVNGFGETAVAAYGVNGRIDTISFFPAMSISMAVSILSGQNIGAKKHERVHQVFKWGLIMAVTISAVNTVVFLSIPHLLMSAFVKDPAVIDIGTTYLRILGPSATFFSIAFVANGVINGSGHTRMTLFFTIFSLWCVRVPIILWLSKTTLGLTGVWIGSSIGYASLLLVTAMWYKTGRWKKTVINPLENADAAVAADS